MALEDDPTGAPGMTPPVMQPVDPYAVPVWPPPQWLQPQPVVPPVLPPDLMPPPLDASGRKGGSTSPTDVQHLGPGLTQSTGELPPPVPLPDVNPMADTDPRLDMTPEELAAKPPQLGEMDTDFVGKPAPDAVPAPASFSELPSDVEKQQDAANLDQLYADTGARTPQDRADVADFYAAKKQADQQRDQLKQAQDDSFKQQNDNYARYQQALIKATQDTAQIDSDAKKISTMNPNRWMQSRSTGQMIAAGIAAFIGGFESFNTGGKNTGLDMIQRAIEQDTEAQKYNIAQQQNQIAQRRASVSEKLGLDIDAYKAAEAHRAALYDHAITQIQTAAQDYDPRGSMARQATQYVGQLQAQRQMGMIEGQKKLAELRKSQADAEHTEAETLKLGAETTKLMGQLGGGAAKPAVDFGAKYGSLNDIPDKLHDRAFRLPSGQWAVAPSKDSAAEATTFVKQYKQLDYNLNELQKLSIERQGAKSVGGSFSDKWKTDDEQHYKQLLTDAVNRYGLMIHGRAPTQGVLEEVLHSFPDLKSAWERGDTTYLLGKMRDDIDNRGTLELSAYGADEKLRTPRPKQADVNINTLSTPLLEKPVKGDAGFARFDVANGNSVLDAIAKQYQDNPRLAESESYRDHLGRIQQKQEQNLEEIRGEVEALRKKNKRTSAEDERLANDTRALTDREEMVKAIEDAKKRDIEAERARNAAKANKEKDAMGRPSAEIPSHFEKL